MGILQSEGLEVEGCPGSKGGCTDHLVGGPQGDDLNVPVLIGDGVAVSQPVKVMHHSAAHRTTHAQPDTALA